MYIKGIILNIVRSEEDRRRLIQLLQLAEPIEQTVKLYYDRRPEKTEKYANNNYDPDSLSLNKNVTVTGAKAINKSTKFTSKSKLGQTSGSNSSTKLTRPQTVSKFKQDNTNFFPLEYR